MKHLSFFKKERKGFRPIVLLMCGLMHAMHAFTARAFFYAGQAYRSPASRGLRRKSADFTTCTGRWRGTVRFKQAMRLRSALASSVERRKPPSRLCNAAHGLSPAVTQKPGGRNFLEPLIKVHTTEQSSGVCRRRKSPPHQRSRATELRSGACLSFSSATSSACASTAL